ncbi:aminopeptidase P family protein [Fusibacter sp. JL216-2]|uniref:aminopeptidase P family protein n=1 Tax=Fusibacter sp. JL216-2 TaxID=3071453 RepID=UPI003D353452
MINERIKQLREEMKKNGIDVYIIPSSDPHQSEYVPERWKSRTWITGFTGSAGTALVTLEKAYLWADGRYHIQAADQLKGSEIELVKWGLEGVPDVHEWLAENLEDGKCIGFDGNVVSLSTKKKYDAQALPKKFTYKTELDLIDLVWTDRPDMPSDEIMVHQMPYAGNTVEEKLTKLHSEMEKSNTDYQIITTLDDVAWLYNYRGSDISYSPVALAYAVVSSENAWLFIDENKLSDEAKTHFENSRVNIKAYQDINAFLSSLPADAQVAYDPSQISVALYASLSNDVIRVENSNPVAMLKSMKSDEEIANMRNSQVRDGVAMVKFIMWLEEAVKNGEASELSAEKMLCEFRSEQEHFVAESFHTIAGYKEHGAMMHYSATEASNYTLKPEGFFLFDSGGNYLDGTTDITRTVALGPVSDQMKKDFTLTLKSHIALSRLRFLHGATGSKIEMIARQPMWAEGLDYKCGTGHGVGYFMNVHEGPQTMKMDPNPVKLQPGMILTNEPGVYREGQYGIRLENTLVIQKDIETEFGLFLNFETISYCPIDTKPIAKEILSEEEVKWLNDYHKTVFEKLSPYLNEDESYWLAQATKAI